METLPKIKPTEERMGDMVIAQFMGYFDDTIRYCEKKNIPYNWKEDTVEIESLKYGSSWDWLMPVVDKIEKISTPESKAVKY